MAKENNIPKNPFTQHWLKQTKVKRPSFSKETSNKITIIVPAKNEEDTIYDVVKSCQNYANEVIVVDGNSTDRTLELAKQSGAKVITQRNPGKGRALIEGSKSAAGEILVFIDADGSHNPHDIPKLVDPILQGDADHVQASRLVGGSQELHGTFDEFFRLSGSAFITASINKRFGVTLSDSQNGFRAISKRAFFALHLREPHTTIEQEMIMKSLKRGLRLLEVPSHEFPRLFGKSHINLLSATPQYFASLCRGLF